MAEAPLVQDIAWSDAERATPPRAAYKTFPSKIAPALVGSGAAFALIGALGAWIRSVEVTSTSSGTPQQVGVLWGYSDATGRSIAILAGVTLFIAAISHLTSYLPRLAQEGAALTLSIVLIVRLLTLNSRASDIATAAKSNPNFQAFNAGFGWGAWLMLLGLVLVFLGFLVGALRELDLRRGLSE
jgi:hypothetical protein